MLVFEESRKPENQEKNVDRRNDKNQKQNQPTYDAESGNLALGGRGGGGGEDSHIEQTGILVGNFEFNS